MTVSRVRGDRTLEFLARGYGFGMHHFDARSTDAFETRIVGMRATFLRGADWARFFYEGARFTRERALPPTVVRSLQDKGSVQTLTGDMHRVRKATFLDVLDDSAQEALRETFVRHWQTAWAEQPSGHDTVIDEFASRVLTSAVAEWVDVSLSGDQLTDRTREFMAMIHGAGSFGPGNWRGLLLRSRTERWAQSVIQDARAQADARSQAVGDRSNRSPIAALIDHRDADGSPLTDEVAAVELLNLMRPTVAVARFIVFAGLALHRHPSWRPKVADDPAIARAFAQEVRRTAPFFPAVAGRAARQLEHGGATFDEGAWVMLDMFATNRDPRLWERPMNFRPERFFDGDPHRNALIPQGAGFFEDGHRCPGEPATVDLLSEAVQLLAREPYEVPAQNLSVDLRRMPAKPASGFIVRRRSAHAAAHADE